MNIMWRFLKEDKTTFAGIQLHHCWTSIPSIRRVLYPTPESLAHLSVFIAAWLAIARE